jgi:hypothetical protein
VTIENALLYKCDNTRCTSEKSVPIKDFLAVAPIPSGWFKVEHNTAAYTRFATFCCTKCYVVYSEDVGLEFIHER